ncbi:hypothetical protein BH10PSE3_BH10PSE3_34770 [soil metagenome]
MYEGRAADMTKRTVAMAFLASWALAAAPDIVRADPPSAATEPVRIDKARIDAALEAMVASGRAVGVSALAWMDEVRRAARLARLVVMPKLDQDVSSGKAT